MCVSVDQLESMSPGFIAQLKGNLTSAKYRYATVFVDQYSKLSFVFLQNTLTSVETLQAKMAFENFCADRGVKVLNYHADNGRIADNGFINDCHSKGQGLHYCGINAHFQNGLAEKKIRYLKRQGKDNVSV